MVKEKGCDLSRVKRHKTGVFDGYIKLTVKTANQTRSVAGTVFSDGKPRFIQIKGINLDADVGNHMVYITNTDVPGMIGFIGSTLGDAGVNIANFQLGREKQAAMRSRCFTSMARFGERARQAAGRTSDPPGKAAGVQYRLSRTRAFQICPFPQESAGEGLLPLCHPRQLRPAAFGNGDAAEDERQSREMKRVEYLADQKDGEKVPNTGMALMNRPGTIAPIISTPRT